jgi:RHS repeat-associated protein
MKNLIRLFAVLMLLVCKAALADVTFVHTDVLGSPVAETNSAGQLVRLSHYKPFGEELEQKKDDVAYTGHKYDAALGLIYMQARYYDPVIGRFYSNDPIGFRDVHSFNRYAYANNNPYKYIDPDGMKVVFANEETQKQYNIAKAYLTKNSPTAVTLFKNAESLQTPTINISLGKQSMMTPATAFADARIQFDPKTSYIFEGGTQSPATGLAHELIHVENQWDGMDMGSRVEGAETIRKENLINAETGEGKRAIHNEINYKTQDVSAPNCRANGEGGEICG